VSVSVAMTVAAMRVRMTLQQESAGPTGEISHTYVMVVSAHSEHTEQVHSQAKGADEQQLTGIHFRRVEAGTDGQHFESIGSRKEWHTHSLDRLEHDKYRDQDEEDSVSKPRQRFDPPISVGEPLIGGPSRHHRCYQSDGNGHAIKRHMYR